MYEVYGEGVSIGIASGLKDSFGKLIDDPDYFDRTTLSSENQISDGFGPSIDENFYAMARLARKKYVEGEITFPFVVVEASGVTEEIPIDISDLYPENMR